MVGVSGFGIGSAGLPAYNLLIEGFSESMDNDVVLSMKQANMPAVSRFVDRTKVERYFDHEGHRTVVSQRALQSHTDPLLGYTTIDGSRIRRRRAVALRDRPGAGTTFSSRSEIAPVVEQLGRATAKVHCASDEDSDQSLVQFQVEDAVAEVLQGRRKAFVDAVVDFGIDYAAIGAARPCAVRRRLPLRRYRHRRDVGWG